MRRAILLTVAILALVVCSDTHTGPDEGITFFEHPNFEGSSHTTKFDVFDFDRISGPCGGGGDAFSSSDWDNCISSLQVSPGWEATLYEHDEYEGDTLIVTGDIRNLDDVSGPCGNDWDDCISSVRVSGPGLFAQRLRSRQSHATVHGQIADYLDKVPSLKH